MLIDFNLWTMLLLAGGFGGFGWYLVRKRAWERDRMMIYGGFALYLLCASSVTIFPLAFIGSGMPPNLGEYISLIPGVNLFHLDSLIAFVVAIPFGFGFPLLHPFRLTPKWVLLAFVPGLAVEAMQLLGALASGLYTWRYIGVNDILLYTLGIAAGYAIFRAASSLFLELYPEVAEGFPATLRETCLACLPPLPVSEDVPLF